jgi:hypothetical protein
MVASAKGTALATHILQLVNNWLQSWLIFRKGPLLLATLRLSVLTINLLSSPLHCNIWRRFVRRPVEFSIGHQIAKRLSLWPFPGHLSFSHIGPKQGYGKRRRSPAPGSTTRGLPSPSIANKRPDRDAGVRVLGSRWWQAGSSRRASPHRPRLCQDGLGNPPLRMVMLEALLLRIGGGTDGTQ